MIHANELRIGNWLIIEDGGFKQMRLIDIGWLIDFPDLFIPIPLTPEILEKCGFEKAIDGMRISMPISDNLGCDNYHLYRAYDSNEFFIAGDKENSGFGRFIIQYLHQLQNLYFAITGEEIKIEL